MALGTEKQVLKTKCKREESKQERRELCNARAEFVPLSIMVSLQLESKLGLKGKETKHRDFGPELVCLSLIVIHVLSLIVKGGWCNYSAWQYMLVGFYSFSSVFEF